MFYNGFRIVVNPLIQPTPVLQLRENVVCSDRVRAEIDRYLLETFGKRELTFRIEGTVYVGPRAFRELEKLVKPRGDLVPTSLKGELRCWSI